MREDGPLPKARARGRPKNERAESVILHATDEILARKGYKATTVDAIAARAGVAKATIYRRWKNKASVVIDAVHATSELGDPFVDTGDFRADFQQQLFRFVVKLRGPTGKKMRAIFSEAQNDPSLAEAFREKIWLPGRAITLAALEGAIARGHLRSDVDLPVLSDAIYGAIYYRLLVGHAALDPRFIERLVDVVLSGAMCPPSNVAAAGSGIASKAASRPRGRHPSAVR
ncbi:MAG TPA: TetR/AcrR family transcriptional regulator [Geminicoccaceae bacterium]|nr:TetR/AcrR family transcriptional regulator [Geminicoccaceae bacterium]